MGSTGRCSKCGRPVPQGMDFCTSCGGLAVSGRAPGRGSLPIGAKKAGCEITGSARITALAETYSARSLHSKDADELEFLLVTPMPDLAPERLEAFMGFLYCFEKLGREQGFRRIVSWERDSEGALLIAMERAPGRSLATRLVGVSGSFRALEPRLVHDIMADICKSLAELHKEWPYGGLCPERVFLEFDRAPVLDLPLEPWLVPDLRSWPWLTYFQACCLAPELIQGEPVSVSSDVYSLGALAYHMATGRPKAGFAGPAESTSVSAPKGLDDLVQRCISEQPSNRYLTVSDVLDEVERVFKLQDEVTAGGRGDGQEREARAPQAKLRPLPTPGEGLEPRALKGARNRLAFLASAIAAILAVVVGYLYISRQGGGPANSRVSGKAVLSVETVPMGVTVNLDGVVLGTTPLVREVDATPGNHYIRLGKAGFADVLVKVTLEPGKTRKVSCELKKLEQELGP